MINWQRRKRYAEVLRHFASGRITNKMYEEQAERLLEEMPSTEQDEALFVIFGQTWYLYDDFKEHRLRGKHALTPEGKREITRWVLFLYSDQEYRWPRDIDGNLSGCVWNMLTFGLWGVITRPSRERRLAMIGDITLWPFLNRAALDEARRYPPLLCPSAR